VDCPREIQTGTDRNSEPLHGGEVFSDLVSFDYTFPFIFQWRKSDVKAT